jgi:hypothetical protein
MQAFIADSVAFRYSTPVSSSGLSMTPSSLCEPSARELLTSAAQWTKRVERHTRGPDDLQLTQGPPRTPLVPKSLIQQRGLRPPRCFGQEMRFDAGKRG